MPRTARHILTCLGLPLKQVAAADFWDQDADLLGITKNLSSGVSRRDRVSSGSCGYAALSLEMLTLAVLNSQEGWAALRAARPCPKIHYFCRTTLNLNRMDE